MPKNGSKHAHAPENAYDPTVAHSALYQSKHYTSLCAFSSCFVAGDGLGVGINENSNH